MTFNGVRMTLLLLFGISSLKAVLALTDMAGQPTEEDKLLADLLDGYNPYARPVDKADTALEVMTSFAVMSILSVDDRRQTVSVSGILTLTWTDCHLKWNPAKYGNVYSVELPSNSVWRPGTGLSNSVVDEDFHLKQSSKNDVEVFSNGMVQWSISKIFAITCLFDLTIFPFDTQSCAAVFVSLTQKGSSVYYTANGYSTARFALPNTEWDLANFSDSAALVPMSLSGDQGTFNWTDAVYQVEFSLKRRTGYYWINLITPCMCCSFLVAMTFYMPCDAGEKLSFSITVLLAFTVYQLIIADNLPRSSDRTPLLSVYLTLLTALSASAVTLAMFVLNLHHHDPNKPLPSWMKTLVFNCLATITCKRKAVREISPLDTPEQLNQVQPIGMQITHPKVAFVEDAKKGPRADLDDLLKGSTLNSAAGTTEGAYGPHWKLAAEIFDRFFMIVFLLSTVALTVAIMFIMPHLYTYTPLISSPYVRL